MANLLTVQQAAYLMGVSRRHVDRLIGEAQKCPQVAKWREGRDFVDLSLPDSTYRSIRIMPEALGLPVEQVRQDPGW